MASRYHPRGGGARRRIAANDEVRFASYPLGGNGQGGGKQILGLVALIAVAAFATFITRSAAPDCSARPSNSGCSRRTRDFLNVQMPPVMQP